MCQILWGDRVGGAALTAALSGAGPWFVAPVRCFRAVLAIHRRQPNEAIQWSANASHIFVVCATGGFVYALAPLAAAASLKGDYTWAAQE